MQPDWAHDTRSIRSITSRRVASPNNLVSLELWGEVDQAAKSQKYLPGSA
jgi:hypothetical protein